MQPQHLPQSRTPSSFHQMAKSYNAHISASTLLLQPLLPSDSNSRPDTLVKCGTKYCHPIPRSSPADSIPSMHSYHIPTLSKACPMIIQWVAYGKKAQSIALPCLSVPFLFLCCSKANSTARFPCSRPNALARRSTRLPKPVCTASPPPPTLVSCLGQ